MYVHVYAGMYVILGMYVIDIDIYTPTHIYNIYIYIYMIIYVCMYTIYMYIYIHTYLDRHV